MSGLTPAMPRRGTRQPDAPDAGGVPRQNSGATRRAARTFSFALELGQARHRNVR